MSTHSEAKSYMCGYQLSLLVKVSMVTVATRVLGNVISVYTIDNGGRHGYTRYSTLCLHLFVKKEPLIVIGVEAAVFLRPTFLLLTMADLSIPSNVRFYCNGLHLEIVMKCQIWVTDCVVFFG